jgi:crotonobetainyl-CoA:carnitine CoA-transferase CaiB-like acyl-CoA transferase
VLGRRLDEAGVPNAPLLDVGQVAGHPQTQALGMAEKSSPEGIDLVGLPLSFDGRRPRASSAAPALGQDNGILRE